MAETKSKFSGRAFISLNTTISFIVLIVSSVILYIMPPGRDAYWTDWRLWGMSKDQWGALHTVGGLAFVIFGIIHLIPYNWKVFWNYIISKIRKNLNKKAELAAALVLNVLIVLVCVFNWVPSSTIMNWGASLKNSWVSTAGQKFVMEPKPPAGRETCRSREWIRPNSARPALPCREVPMTPLVWPSAASSNGSRSAPTRKLI